VNWDFGSGKAWVGANSTWTDDANWSPTGLPGSTNVVLIDGSAASTPRLTAPTTLLGLTVAGVSGPATLTVDMPFAGGELTVVGDADIGADATLTHTAGNETYRVALNVGSNLTVAAGGSIDVTARGFAATLGPGGKSNRNGAGHGGQGSKSYDDQAGLARAPAYGSVLNPVRCGSGSAGTAGGGAVLLTVAEIFSLDGSLVADGQTGGAFQGAGAGGSVNVTAGAIAGTGTVSADGGANTSPNAGGGGGAGGRIAVMLTDSSADFSAFDPANVSALGGIHSDLGQAEPGAAGTIYLRTGAELSGQGTVTIDHSATSGARTQVPPPVDAVPDELTLSTVIVTNRGAMAVTTNAAVSFLTVAGANTLLELGAAGTVLRVSGDMSFGGTTYTKGGFYTTSNWNGFTPVPPNVSGDGAIQIWRAAGTVVVIR
jgi:hypothetical protein